MILLLLFILFQYSFQIMRSPCQEDCEADVSIISTCCHAFVVFNLSSCFLPLPTCCHSLYSFSTVSRPCEAYGKNNAKSMSVLFSEAAVKASAKPTQDECEADVNIMRSLCQEECETDVSIILRSCCQSECEADVKMNPTPMSI